MQNYTESGKSHDDYPQARKSSRDLGNKEVCVESDSVMNNRTRASVELGSEASLEHSVGTTGLQ